MDGADGVAPGDGAEVAAGGVGMTRAGAPALAERRAAFAAESDPLLVRCPAGRAGNREPRSTLATELATGLVLGAAGRADHRLPPVGPWH